jgi:hypothetical protein
MSTGIPVPTTSELYAQKFKILNEMNVINANVLKITASRVPPIIEMLKIANQMSVVESNLNFNAPTFLSAMFPDTDLTTPENTVPQILAYVEAELKTLQTDTKYVEDQLRRSND